ncbi:MAG: preprotein translocase subunit YajC [Mariprofundaceae bacterium]|nr:preprotein translocase subunit YajC [Mariprofundaceae bacterium]
MFSRTRLLLAAVATLLATSSVAYAGDGMAGGFAQLVPLILIMVVFWFLLIRPQQKRMKEHRNMVEALKKGDKIVTNSGIFATIIDIKDDFIRVEIADGVRIKMQRDAVTSLSD